MLEANYYSFWAETSHRWWDASKELHLQRHAMHRSLRWTKSVTEIWHRRWDARNEQLYDSLCCRVTSPFNNNDKKPRMVRYPERTPATRLDAPVGHLHCATELSGSIHVQHPRQKSHTVTAPSISTSSLSTDTATQDRWPPPRRKRS